MQHAHNWGRLTGICRIESQAADQQANSFTNHAQSCVYKTT